MPLVRREMQSRSPTWGLVRDTGGWRGVGAVEWSYRPMLLNRSNDWYSDTLLSCPEPPTPSWSPSGAVTSSH